MKREKIIIEKQRGDLISITLEENGALRGGYIKIRKGNYHNPNFKGNGVARHSWRTPWANEKQCWDEHCIVGLK